MMEKTIITSYKKIWIDPVDDFIKKISEKNIPNLEYHEKQLKMLSGIKNFLQNYIIKSQCYDYITLSSVADLLKRLAYGLPLYQITDIPEEWTEVKGLSSNPEEVVYQAIRYSPLFKTINTITGEITYSDMNRFEGYSNINSVYGYEAHYHSGLIDNVVSQVYPITMPYYPTFDNIKVIAKDFLVNPLNGDFDTVGIFYSIHPYDGKKIINRFFKESSKEKFGWKEISYMEYLFRWLLKINPHSKRAKKIRKQHHKSPSNRCYLEFQNSGEGSSVRNENQ